MEQLKTFVNTYENINPDFKVEFTMDCKVIYGFDLSLSKRFHCFNFHCRGRGVESMKLFGFDLGLIKIRGQVYGQQLYRVSKTCSVLLRVLNFKYWTEFLTSVMYCTVLFGLPHIDYCKGYLTCVLYFSVLYSHP